MNLIDVEKVKISYVEFMSKEPLDFEILRFEMTRFSSYRVAKRGISLHKNRKQIEF